jgi:hypothetical protein
MADKVDAASIVSARNVAAQLARKPNGSFNREEAERVFDWIMAPVMEAAAERQAAAEDRMAKARAARKLPSVITHG